MRGISTETIMLIAAIILVIAIIAIMWLRGIGPFQRRVKEGMCKEQILRACNEGEWSGVAQDCPDYLGAIKSKLENCLSSNDPFSQDCRDVCNWLAISG